MRQGLSTDGLHAFGDPKKFAKVGGVLSLGFFLASFFGRVSFSLLACAVVAEHHGKGMQVLSKVSRKAASLVWETSCVVAVVLSMMRYGRELLRVIR